MRGISDLFITRIDGLRWENIVKICASRPNFKFCEIFWKWSSCLIQIWCVSNFDSTRYENHIQETLPLNISMNIYDHITERACFEREWTDIQAIPQHPIKAQLWPDMLFDTSPKRAPPVWCVWKIVQDFYCIGISDGYFIHSLQIAYPCSNI